jgi:nucleoside-diphosphate-sugar epimerase
MKVFLAGATGAIGQALVPRLVAAGHEVVGTTRSKERAKQIEDAGATAVVVDPFDRAALTAAVVEAGPDAVIHQLTALKNLGDFKNPDADFETTNRLRTETTDVLIAAAQEAGAKTFIAQSFAGWPMERSGPAVKDETAAWDPHPAKGMVKTHAAIKHLEEATVAADGIVLRYGGFYGPGTSIDAGGTHIEMIKKRKFPIVGNGAGVWSLVHIEDAADATVKALESGKPGVYHVTDDEPAPVNEWLPVLAELAGAKKPLRVPKWIAKFAAGEAGVMMMTEIRGASNEKAKRELGWQPAHPTWRTGFKETLNGST